MLIIWALPRQTTMKWEQFTTMDTCIFKRLWSLAALLHWCIIIVSIRSNQSSAPTAVSRAALKPSSSMACSVGACIITNRFEEHFSLLLSTQITPGWKSKAQICRFVCQVFRVLCGLGGPLLIFIIGILHGVVLPPLYLVQGAKSVPRKVHVCPW